MQPRLLNDIIFLISVSIDSLCRNTINICMLILYLETYLTHVSSVVFVTVVFRFFGIFRVICKSS